MSVASEITRINNNIANAYTQVSNKGGTLPQIQNSNNLADAIASITGGGIVGLEYETGTYEPEENTTRPTISFSNSHNRLPIYVAIFDTTLGAVTGTNTCIEWSYLGNYDFCGETVPSASSTRYYGATFGRYLRSGTSFSTAGAVFPYPSSNPTDTTSTYIRYHVTEEHFIPGTFGSTNTTFRRYSTYKWIAIWW